MVQIAASESRGAERYTTSPSRWGGSTTRSQRPRRDGLRQQRRDVRYRWGEAAPTDDGPEHDLRGCTELLLTHRRGGPDGDRVRAPPIFTKSHRALVGHDEPIEYDTRVTTDLDYEGELAAVIGKPGRHIDESDALDHVAGYTVLNDITARDLQNVRAEDAEWLDWFSSKALQRSTPVGPAVVTADEVGDPSDLHIETRHNGDVVQDEGTHLMIYDVADLVSFVSTRVRLQPGDIVATGTPKGSGTSRTSPSRTGTR